jgi:DNA-binding transcriptional LysR family regulator
MDIRRADLPLLISLDALLEDLNVTRASRRLNITQSTLSGHLARLRDLFGDPLLVPAKNGRGMVPTERALELQARLRETLHELQSIVANSMDFDPASSQRTFVVAINDNAFTMIGLAVAEAITSLHGPGIRTSYLAPDVKDLAQRMERGEVDLFIGATRSLPESLKHHPLITDEFRMAQRKGHPRGKKKLSLDAYCKLEHMLVSPAGGFRSPIDDHLARLGKDRRVVLTVPGYNQIALMLKCTDLVATLPNRLLRHYASDLDVFDLPFDMPPFTLSMAWHPRSHENPAHKWLREQFLAAAER